MGAVRTVALAGLRRHRLPTIAIAVVLALATAAATLGLAIILEAQAPFDSAFARENGAHLVLTYDTGVAPAEAIAATAHAAGVTATAGPWPVASIQFAETLKNRALGNNAAPGNFTLHILRPGRVQSRPSPDTTVDRVDLDTGRWWQKSGEIVVARSIAWADGLRLGDNVELQQPAGSGGFSGFATPNGTTPPSSGPTGASRQVTIVGIATSISEPGLVGWVSPDDLAAVTPGQAPQVDMLYRVSLPASAGDVAATTDAIVRGLPSGAVAASQTYLATRDAVNRTGALMVPILLAFAAFALLAAAFMTVNVVSGIVLASYREIGVLKAIGCTPGQVAAVLVAQTALPGLVGAVAGLLGGVLASQPVLGWTAASLGIPVGFAVSPVVVAGVLGVAVGAVVIAALGPALRAARLTSAAAIAHGTSPAAGRIGRLRQAVLRLALPEADRIGVATGLARPLRAAMTLGALAVGIAAVVFTVGVTASLGQVASDFNRDIASPIRVSYEGGAGEAVAKPGSDGSAGAPSTLASPAQVTGLIRSNPQTGRSVTIGQASVDVGRLPAPIPFVGYEGDSSWIGYALIDGRWFGRPGEAVAPSNFFDQAGLRVGDAVTVRYQGRQLRVTLVGEILDQPREQRQGLLLRGEWSDLASIDPAVQPSAWEVQPAAGVQAGTYRSNLQDALGPAAGVDVARSAAADPGFLLFESVVATLGLVLVIVAAAGVFNTVLLDVRERARELAVLKAVGMAPRQVVRLVLAGVVPVALAAGVIGVPLGIVLQRAVLAVMGQAAVPTALPESVFGAAPLGVVLALGLSGLVIAALAAWLPAWRTARSRIAPVLAAE